MRFGYLKKSDMKNDEAFAAAKKKYEADIGEPLETRFHHDTAGVAEHLNFK